MLNAVPQTEGRKLFWLSILFLIPTYLQRLANSGQGDRYGEFDGISLAPVGYVSNILIILYCIFVAKNTFNRTHLIFAVGLFIYGLVQIYVSYNVYGDDLPQMLFSYLRALMWAFCAYAFAAKLFDKAIFVEAFMAITSLFFVVVILSALQYALTGIPFGMVIGQGVERAHGTFTEPSVLGAIAPAYVLIALINRNYVMVTIGVAALYFANSTTAYTTFILTLAVFVCFGFPRLQKFILFAVVLAFAFFLIQIDLQNSYFISDLARSFSEFLDSTIGKSDVRAFTIDRLLNSIIDIPKFLSSGETDYTQELGSLARLGGPRVMITHMYNDGLYWYGYGLSIFAVISLGIYKSVLDFGILPYFLSCFGVGFGMIIILFFTSRVVWWRDYDRSAFILFTSTLFGTILNSAGGLSVYIFVLLGAFSAVIQKPLLHSKVGDT